MTKVKLSKCCRSDVDIVNSKNFRAGNRNEIYYCMDCDEKCEVDEVCADCLGEGTLNTDGTDSDGNTERGVNTIKCHCMIPDYDYDDYED